MKPTSATPVAPEILIARQAMERLAALDMLPTPPNFLIFYNEIAGITGKPPFPEGPLQHLAEMLAGAGTMRQQLATDLAAAIAERSWSGIEQALLTTLTASADAEQALLIRSLRRLLQLIVENIGDLTPEESWLKGQADSLLAAIDGPLAIPGLESIEQRLRDVISIQRDARRQSLDTEESMRSMLASFIASLAQISQSSSDFQHKMEESARRIANADTVDALGPLLQDVVSAARAMASESSTTHDHLQQMQEKAEAAEAALAHLRAELETASAQARHDPLTDALNRKGLDDALAREIAAARRRGTPLSICLLDIDNFKKLNDRLGHEAGDHALVHLTQVTRHCLRPTDTLARYGGEEFVILMADTPLQAGIEAMTRLQRELTKTFFLADNERVLITFSAGVTELRPEESGEEAIHRADLAMYQAKRTGKNRVVGA